MDTLELELKRTLDRIAAAKAVVTRQSDVFSELREAGYPSAVAAEDTLKTFIQALRDLEDYELSLRQEIAERDELVSQASEANEAGEFPNEPIGRA